jgi:hypothetical protein
MSSAANGQQHFRIAFSAAVAESIRRLVRRATREGRGKAFLLALRQAIDRLRDDPTDFGEPLYRLPALRMQIRCAVIGPLGIDFAIRENERVVFVKTVKLL